MPKLPYRFATAALLAAGSFAIAQPATAAGMSVRTLAAQEARVATMAYRMATANAQLCSRPEMLTGMILHDLTQYEPARRDEVSRAFALHSGFGVLQLVPDSAAARAGLRIDDEIIAVDGTSVQDPAADRTSSRSVRRMEGFSKLLQARLARGPTELVIRRNGQVQAIDVSGERGCGGQLSLAASPRLNAWADGRHIILTTGMDRFARSDDEIAFVIAHEMAHNILGHLTRTGSIGIFGFPRARDYELDADGFAIRLMQGAGYRPAAAISFLERSRRRLWWALSLSHPGFDSRIKAVTAEIARSQAIGSSLPPVSGSQDAGRIAGIAAAARPDLVLAEPGHAVAQATLRRPQTMSGSASGLFSQP